MALCSQCANNAMVKVEGHPLCLDHYKVWSDIHQQKLDESIRAPNCASKQFELAAGMPGLLPRYEVRRPAPTIKAESMTFNNNVVKDSVVGVINTGNVKKLDVAVDVVRDSGGQQLAAILQKLSQAVVDALDLTPEQKDEGAVPVTHG